MNVSSLNEAAGKIFEQLTSGRHRVNIVKSLRSYCCVVEISYVVKISYLPAASDRRVCQTLEECRWV